MPELSIANLPFEEAIAFFKQKVPLPTSAWDEIINEAQDWAFTVAGLTKAEMLNDIYQAIEQALEEGTTLEEFTRKFDETAARYGWEPPPGKEDLWGGWRMQLIYMQNLQSAYAAGRLQQMRDPDVARSRPYWLWRHRDSRNPRPAHLALDGKVFRGDSVFWQVGYPPCGYGCKCGVYALTEDDVQRRGLKVEDAPTEQVTLRDRITGEEFRVPAINGQPIVDPGFVHAPGASLPEQRRGILVRSLERLPVALRRQARAEIERRDFADFAVSKQKRKKQCDKGFSCGNSCITKGKRCRTSLNEQSSKYADWMADQGDRVTYSPNAESNELEVEVKKLRDAFIQKQNEFNSIQERMLKGERLKNELEEKREELLEAQKAYGDKKKELKKLTQTDNTPRTIPKVETTSDPKAGKTFKALIKDGKKFLADTDTVSLNAAAKALAKHDKKLAAKFDALSDLYSKTLALDASDEPEEVKKKAYFDFRKAQVAYNKMDLDGYGERQRLIAAIEPGMANIRQRLIDRSDPAMAKAFAERLTIRDSIPVEMQSSLREQMEDFYRVTGGKGARLASLEKTDNRAHASDYARSINVGNGIDSQHYATLWHEAGHHVEFESRGTVAAASAWVKSRASGEPMKLNALIPGARYDDREVAYPDRFISPYVGKIYGDSYSEVISMGLEHFNTPGRMSELYSKDSEHFFLVLGAILD
jgi:hypothetical protein